MRKRNFNKVISWFRAAAHLKTRFYIGVFPMPDNNVCWPSGLNSVFVVQDFWSQTFRDFIPISIRLETFNFPRTSVVGSISDFMSEHSRRDHHLSLPPFLRGRPISLVWFVIGSCGKVGTLRDGQLPSGLRCRSMLGYGKESSFLRVSLSVSAGILVAWADEKPQLLFRVSKISIPPRNGH